MDFVCRTGLYRDRPPAQPRLVLLDLDLPSRSGFDVLEELRAHYSKSVLPVVIFTGSANEYVSARALALGANDYRLKATDYEEYASGLRELVTGYAVSSAW